MSSGSAMPREVMSERLAELRDATLLSGENVVIQQVGDHGQGVVITDSRVMIIKTGLTATGSINGQNVTAFKFDEIGIVNLRRGPMGAIVQIIGKEITPNSGTRPPENMAIFSGEQKVKKLEILIDKLVEIPGITVNRVEWVAEVVSDANQSNVCTEHIEPKSLQTQQDSMGVQSDTDHASITKKPRAPRKKPLPKPNTITVVSENEVSSNTEKIAESDTEITLVKSSNTVRIPDQGGAPELISSGVQNDIADISKEISKQSNIDAKGSTIPEAATPPKGVQRLSLAEEIFAELSAEESNVPASVVIEKADVKKPQPGKLELRKPKVLPIQVTLQVDTPSHVVKQDDTLIAVPGIPVEEYGPNPRLSAYMKKNKPMNAGAIVVLVVLGIMVISGLAVMNRINNTVVTPIENTVSTKDMSLLKSRLTEVGEYRKHLSKLMAKSNYDANRMERALSVRDVHGIGGTVSVLSHQKVLEKLQELEPPMGLRIAQSMLQSAVTDRKTVATAVSNALTGASIVDPGKSNLRLKAANNRIQKAFGEVTALERSLRSQISM